MNRWKRSFILIGFIYFYFACLSVYSDIHAQSLLLSDFPLISNREREDYNYIPLPTSNRIHVFKTNDFVLIYISDTNYCYDSKCPMFVVAGCKHKKCSYSAAPSGPFLFVPDALPLHVMGQPRELKLWTQCNAAASRLVDNIASIFSLNLDSYTTSVSVTAGDVCNKKLGNK